MSQPDHQYLFLCGCPRSGTTALWKLLGSHPNVILGVERFSNLVRKTWSLSPDHFTKERFFSIQDGDTFYDSIDYFHERSGLPAIFRDMEQKFDDYRFIGDKLPYLYYNFDGLQEAFPGAQVVFILRNIFDVANSFEARLNRPNDNWKQDSSAAITHWNAGLQKVMSAPKGLNLHIVLYEDLFGPNPMHKETLFKRLGLSVGAEARQIIEDTKSQSAEVNTRRARHLSHGHVIDICHNADFATYNEICSMVRAAEAQAASPI